MFWRIAIANWILAGAMAGLAVYIALAHPTSALALAALFLLAVAALVAAVLAFISARFGP